MTPVLPELTDREEEVALLWGRDELSPAQIGPRLGLTTRQVRRCGERARHKTGKTTIGGVAVLVALAQERAAVR